MKDSHITHQEYVKDLCTKMLSTKIVEIMNILNICHLTVKDKSEVKTTLLKQLNEALIIN